VFPAPVRLLIPEFPSAPLSRSFFPPPNGVGEEFLFSTPRLLRESFVPKRYNSFYPGFSSFSKPCPSPPSYSFTPKTVTFFLLSPAVLLISSPLSQAVYAFHGFYPFPSPRPCKTFLKGPPLFPSLTLSDAPCNPRLDSSQTISS